MISEGQRNDINYAIPLLDQIEINGSNVLADRGYDSNKLLDYVYFEDPFWMGAFERIEDGLNKS